MTRPLPWYYAVNDRPVMIIEVPGGGADALVFDWASGAFVPDRSYFGRVSNTGIGKDVDQFTEEDFVRFVARLRRPIVAGRLASPIAWEATGDAGFPYRTLIDGHTHSVRVNDFPDEPLYTLLVDGQELADLDDWPGAWTTPPIVEPPGPGAEHRGA